MARSAERVSASGQSEVGALLRTWREVRGKSQLDLALDTGVSQRHISFIESGRSSPSRQKLTEIAEGLDIPLRERNALLLAAGYAPIYSQSGLDAPEMASITTVLRRVLRQHEPFPAVVMDRYWNVVMTNDAAPRFFGTFIDMDARPKPRNLLHLMFDPDGMRPFIADWESVSQSLLARVYRESIGRVLDEKTKALLAALRAYADVGQETLLSPSPVLPMVPIGFVQDKRVLNYFSMITTVGTPQTIAAEELRIECMYPADEATEAYHSKLMG
ncbi:helix-turn-helix transcriptional regulator [Acidisoma cellulosilytica]|uniref:Helix-turn-helix transcriptional regulator n=1 Tax=Acidisoma cellulosilyticum TaxID=2802395 RepID=A0A964E342_9PROT|nr:helix-turn-helix transcriptional regulator [Acidisoma cellulosilyticum]MCB8879453.1 helix-turn-helix transcriptional regulator [Acidisoma cellulosilyticum]